MRRTHGLGSALLGVVAVGAACSGGGSGTNNGTTGDDGGASDGSGVAPPSGDRGGVDGGGGDSSGIDSGESDSGGGAGDDGGAEAALPSPFGLDTRPPNPTCHAPARPPSGVSVAFNQVFAGVTLAAPIMMKQIPGDASRVFVAQRAGSIVSFPSASPPAGAPAVVLTVPNPVNTNGEGGFLGFAFHPKFAQNGQIFFSYTQLAAGVAGSQMHSTIARMTSTDGGKTFGAYTEIFGFDQDGATNHKGGEIVFGPDGYLYFGFGDGGGGGDTYIHGQNTNVPFAKIHRIDVDTPPPAGQTYVVPDGNPFKNGGGFPSTWEYGLRNPFRFSFDRASGDLWIGDVGQNLWEEIDRVQAPGANLGWPCYEGFQVYAPDINDPARCPNPKGAFVPPVFNYDHPGGASRAVIGGVVYRGTAVPQMVGTYIFGDEVAGLIEALEYDATNTAQMVQINPQGPNGNWVHFSEDVAGELYVVDIGGKIYRMAAATQPGGDAGAPFPAKLSQTGCVDPAAPQKPASGLIPYTVNSPLWSDGASKDRWLAIPDGKTITVGADGHLDLPIGSVLMKTFSLGGKPIETRLLVRHTDGGWAGYTYEWDDALTDATLLPASATRAVGTQTWYYPSRSDCLLCHSSAAQRTLGMELGQLNGDGVYPATNRVANQLTTLDHIGMFSAALTTPVAQIVAYPAPTGTVGALDARARSYLQANCSLCHQPNGIGGGPMDLRYATPLGNAKACGVAPDNGTLGVAGALILAPGDPSKSLLSLRPHALDANRMPPLASHVVDTNGLAVIDSWIQSVTTCPPPVDAGIGDASDQ